MKALFHTVRGELLQSGDLAALWLHNGAPNVYLRLGIRLKEREAVILPGLVVDDWGHEIASLELYKWVHENDIRFPRAEIFGFDAQGAPRQYFMRELDVMARYPCYAYRQRDTPLEQGILLQAVVVASDSIGAPIRSRPQPDMEPSLRRAQLAWWLCPSGQLPDIDLAALLA